MQAMRSRVVLFACRGASETDVEVEIQIGSFFSCLRMDRYSWHFRPAALASIPSTA